MEHVYAVYILHTFQQWSFQLNTTPILDVGKLSCVIFFFYWILVTMSWTEAEIFDYQKSAFPTIVSCCYVVILNLFPFEQTSGNTFLLERASIPAFGHD